MASFRFTKTHGAGNDFLVVDGPIDLLPTLEAKKLFCDRHYGAGGDGVIFVSRPAGSSVDAVLRIFNSDGSEAEISGNGTRCAAACILSVAGDERDLRVQTIAGVKQLRFISHTDSEYRFEMNMGKPILDAPSVPFRPPESV